MLCNSASLSLLALGPKSGDEETSRGTWGCLAWIRWGSQLTAWHFSFLICDKRSTLPDLDCTALRLRAADAMACTNGRRAGQPGPSPYAYIRYGVLHRPGRSFAKSAVPAGSTGYLRAEVCGVVQSLAPCMRAVCALRSTP